MEYKIREIAEKEYPLLEDFLYEAIYIPKGVTTPSKSIIQKEELQVYIRNFGAEKDDKCFVAEICGKVVGAVWVRIMDDYGSVDGDTPSFAISLYKEYRGFGMGTALMECMLKYLQGAGYKKCSLSVQKANYAVNMYLSVGFEIIDQNEEEYVMVHIFDGE